LSGAARIVEGERMIPVLQCQFRGTREARILNIRSPTQRLVGRRCLFRLRWGVLCGIGSHIINLRPCAASSGDEDCNQSTLQESKSSNHSIHQRKDALAILDTKSAFNVVYGLHLWRLLRQINNVSP
jgi:hypothetical protein